MPIKNYFFVFKKFDWLLLIIVVLLISFGLMAIYSLTINNEAAEFSKFQRQIIFFIVGLFVLFVFSFIDYRIFRSYSFILYLIGGLLLLLVLIFGQNIRGSTAWFSFFGQTFQPVEVAKISLIIFLSRFFTNHNQEMYQFKMIFFSSLIALPYIVLTVLQPDFGSAIILLVIWLGLLFLNKIRRIHVALIIFVLFMIIIFSWFVIFEDYQKERILTFFDPSRDPLGSGYNPIQSIVAVGSGNLFGRGLGLGPQSQLNFLPVQEKDFIFAVISEELGFIGAALLFLFFIFMFVRFIRVLRETSDNFSVFLISGIIISIYSQMFINISMNIGLLPITGIPLPLISYGGSSLISTLVMIGIIESIILRSRIKAA